MTTKDEENYTLQRKLADLNARIANLQDENEQLKFDKKYAEAQIVELRHELAQLKAINWR